MYNPAVESQTIPQRLQVVGVLYVDARGKCAVEEFAKIFTFLLKEALPCHDSLCCLCIGTDRATGDSFGPIVGQKLRASADGLGVSVYGTLDAPIHANNLDECVARIYREHQSPLVVSIDAGLASERVGHICVESGSLLPGAGLQKNLKPVGDISVIGIVNAFAGGVSELCLLQNTSLATVTRMANVVHCGILTATLQTFYIPHTKL